MSAIPSTVEAVTDVPHAEVVYPESDGQPMAETDAHRDNMVAVIEALKDRYRDRPDVYVSGNMFIYYEEGNPSAAFAPDGFVIFGVPKRQRRIYRLWEESNQVPDVVFEVTSRKTWPDDEGNKKAVCRRLGVREYFLYDPYGEYLEPPLQGYRLQAAKYVPMSAEADGGLYSEVLELYLYVEEWMLRLVDARTGEHLLTPLESYAAHREAEARAEAEATARREAEARLAEAEAELARMRAERERAQHERSQQEDD